VRWPRFFSKKRGHRHTGSREWGSIAEGLFYAALLIGGLIFGGLLVSGVAAYAPADPGRVVLQRGYDWWMWVLTLVIPLALVAFGGSGLSKVIRMWGKSDERRAASAGLPEFLDTLGHPPHESPGHPGVPACENLVNSPGNVLRYRLPIESPENWTLLGFGMFALLWNAVVVVLAAGAGANIRRGNPDWLLLALLIPFVAVGVGGVVLFVRAVVLAASVGPTQVEISDHPLVPGQRYEVLLGQGGSGLFKSIELGLELEEQATFCQGTDTRTERLIVWRDATRSWSRVQAVPGGRFEAHVEITIPEQAMHSFNSPHNSVHWRLVVRGAPDRWPPFTRVFPLVVFPAGRNAGATPLATQGGKGVA